MSQTSFAAPIEPSVTIEEIIENFSFLEEWDDRYGYLIELGRSLVPLDEAEKNEENRVQGCVSQVWVVGNADRSGDAPVLTFRGASDAHIVSGLVAIALTLFSGRTAEEILETDEQAVFAEIGLGEHLTPQRANGLRSMVQRLKAMAQTETA
ncbi:SufE family protein [Pseudahrensia aquimaris]|uniref:SufE family protein n=1 Tax=Pseudahrensia aquimaris TaxID=744461 RepID=A0ABW3FGH8_9HYPH